MKSAMKKHVTFDTSTTDSIEVTQVKVNHVKFDICTYSTKQQLSDVKKAKAAVVAKRKSNIPQRNNNNNNNQTTSKKKKTTTSTRGSDGEETGVAVMMETTTTTKDKNDDSGNLEVAIISFENAFWAVYSTASEAASNLMKQAVEYPIYNSLDMELALHKSMESMRPSIESSMESIGKSFEEAMNYVSSIDLVTTTDKELKAKMEVMESKRLLRKQRLQEMKNKLVEARNANESLRREETTKMRRDWEENIKIRNELESRGMI